MVVRCSAARQALQAARQAPPGNFERECKTSRARRRPAEDEHPVVRPDARRPFELPRLGVAEKVDLVETFLVRAFRREVRQQLERRARFVRGVVAGLDQEQAALVAQPNTTSRCVFRRRSETTAAASRARRRDGPAAYRSAGRLRRDAIAVPSRRFQPDSSSRIVSVSAAPIADPPSIDSSTGSPSASQAREPIPDVRTKLGGQASEVFVPRSVQLEIRRIAAAPHAERRSRRRRRTTRTVHAFSTRAAAGPAAERPTGPSPRRARARSPYTRARSARRR